MTKPDPQLRQLPARSEFSLPHAQCRVGAFYFLNILEDQIALLDIAVQEEGGTAEAMNRLAMKGALERQALSEAVQVFAAMTVESAVNLLGVLAMGEDQFLQQLEFCPLIEKLSTILRVIEGRTPNESDELLLLARRLADARNGFVHPKPQEGPPRHIQRERRGDLKSARAAVDD